MKPVLNDISKLNDDVSKLNDDISKLHELRKEYLKIHKNIKKNKLVKSTKNRNSELIFNHMVDFLNVTKTTECENGDISYSIYDQKFGSCYTIILPLKYKKLNVKPFEFKKTKRDFYSEKNFEFIDRLYIGGCFLLPDGRIYTEYGKWYKEPCIFKNLEHLVKNVNVDFIQELPFYMCDRCKKRKKKVSIREIFYEILSYKIAKSKGLNVVCCRLSKDNSARIIQKHVLKWLYSAPNGYFFKKGVKELNEIGILN